jgi:hypothetical protein
VQLLGWELTFAAYSYCMETGGRNRTSYGACLFFLLVNPTLVFPERGRQIGPPALNTAAVLRCAGGLCVLFLNHALYAAAYFEPAFLVAPLYAITTARGYSRFVLHHVVRLLAGYAAHSGLASFRIGWMRLLGHEVPERYRYPLLAISPMDFWRRWNTYTGSWARRYLFSPLSLWLRRRARRMPAAGLTAFAVLVTFVLIGAAHDFSVFVRLAAIGTAGGTLVFAVHGMLLIGWLGAERLLAGVVSADRLESRPALVMRWLLFAHVLLLTVWLAVPAMSGEGVAVPLLELAMLVRRRP